MSWTARLSSCLRMRSDNKGGLVPSFSCGKEHGDSNESCEEFDEGNDENQYILEDCGEDLMRYDRLSQDYVDV